MYKEMLQENTVLAIREHDRTLNAIVESIISTGNVEIFDEISVKDVGAAFVQTIKKIFYHIVDAISIAFTFIGETFNKSYSAFKKYSYLAKTNIDFNKEAEFKTGILSVSKTKHDVINLCIGRLDDVIKEFTKNIGNQQESQQDIKIINALLQISDAKLSATKIDIDSGSSIDWAKYNKNLVSIVVRGESNQEIKPVTHTKIATACKSNADIKKMLAFLSNRRPYTAMAIIKREARIMCNKAIKNASKESGAASNEVKGIIKLANLCMTTITNTLSACKSGYSALSRDYITILSIIAKQTSKEDKESANKKELKMTSSKAYGSSYIDYD